MASSSLQRIVQFAISPLQWCNTLVVNQFPVVGAQRRSNKPVICDSHPACTQQSKVPAHLDAPRVIVRARSLAINKPICTLLKALPYSGNVANATTAENVCQGLHLANDKVEQQIGRIRHFKLSIKKRTK